jgi:hypothetical protein
MALDGAGREKPGKVSAAAWMSLEANVEQALYVAALLSFPGFFLPAPEAHRRLLSR